MAERAYWDGSADRSPTEGGQGIHPEPFVHEGVRWVPTAVVMYGDMNWIIPIGAVTDPEDCDVYAGHIVLYAPAHSGVERPSHYGETESR